MMIYLSSSLKKETFTPEGISVAAVLSLQDTMTRSKSVSSQIEHVLNDDNSFHLCLKFLQF